MEKYTIEYNGKKLVTKNWVEVTEEELKEYYNEYFSKPSFDTVLQQMRKITADGVMIDKITRYYFRELMAKV